MKRLIAMNNPRMAQAFIDFMASKQIEIQMMPEGENTFALWLSQDEHITATEAELQRFLAEPNHGRYHAASWTMAETRKTTFNYATPSFLTLLKAQAGWLTLTGMVLCGLIYLLQVVGLNQTVFSWLHFPDSLAQRWQLWRWVTHALLHFSILHITFNVLWWWQLGGDVEKKVGWTKLLQLFVLSAALSGAGQFWIEGANFGGLSGVVYALVGYIAIMGWRAPQVGLMMPRPLLVFMLVWLVLGFVQPFLAIANTAHLAGLVVGGIIGLVDSSKAKHAAS